VRSSELEEQITRLQGICREPEEDVMSDTAVEDVILPDDAPDQLPPVGGDGGLPTDPADGGGTDPQPPEPEPVKTYTAEDFTRMQNALRKEREQHKVTKTQLSEVKKAHETENERRAREMAEQAAQQAVATIKPQAARAIARAELKAAGINGDPARAVRMLDLDSLELTEDGEIDGLADQIAAMKADYPAMFGKSPSSSSTPPPPANVNGGQGGQRSADGTPPKKKGFADVLADQVLGRTG
jgi:hypothetical protein